MLCIDLCYLPNNISIAGCNLSTCTFKSCEYQLLLSNVSIFLIKMYVHVSPSAHAQQGYSNRLVCQSVLVTALRASSII